MNVKDDRVRVRHMLDAARKTQEFVSGISRADFDSNEMLRLALVRLIEIIGEAATRTTEDYRSAHPDIPWGAMVGMRNRLIHAYFNINKDVLWDTLTTAIPELIPQLEAILQTDDE